MSFKPKGRAKRIAIGLALVSALVGPVMPAHASPPVPPGINTGVPGCGPVEECLQVVQDKVDDTTVVVQNVADLVGRLATEVANSQRCAQTAPGTQFSPGTGVLGPLEGYGTFTVYLRYCWIPRYYSNGRSLITDYRIVVSGHTIRGEYESAWSYDGYTGGAWTDPLGTCLYWDVTGHFSYHGIEKFWNPNSNDSICP